MENNKNPLHEKYGLAKDWYKKNVTVRQGLEQEWREAAQLTLPYVFPTEDTSEEAIMPTPFNSIGAAGVNSLASKLLLALLPPTGVFFRLLPDTKIKEQISKEEIKQLDVDLARVENDVVEYINQKALRVPVYEAIKLLAVTGNAMMYKVPKGGIKVFSPYQYVSQRDYVGNILTQCILEKMDRTALPEKVLKQIASAEGEPLDKEKAEKSEVEVYTMIVSSGPNKFKVWQEIEDIVIDNTEKDYTNTTIPYITLRWTTVNNESYGRGLVSQYIGDLRSLEGLTQTIVEGAGISAMHLFGLRPGSTLKVEDLNNAKNGEFVLGDLEREVSVLQINKGADLQVPLNLMSQLEQRLGRAFMMLGGQIRDSERTTAAEVRATAAELEATLGGVFSVLANEFQTPLITLILQELSPQVLKVSTPSITTGISAISREKDFNNLNTMLQSIAQLGPEVIAQYLNIPAYLAQVATSLGMSPESIVKSQEQIQQEQQAQQQAMMQQQAVQTGSQMLVDNNKQGEK
jgi:hypothetical protein